MQIWDRGCTSTSARHITRMHRCHSHRTWLQHNPLQRYRRGVEFTESLLGLVYRGVRCTVFACQFCISFCWSW